MKTLIILLLFLAAANCTIAQTQPYGKVDIADLKLTDCDFEKGATAMVLFDKGEILCGNYSIDLIRHKRIKIFEDKGQANIRLEYVSKSGIEDISGIEAETINLKNNVIEYTPVDKKLIVKQNINKYQKAIIFMFPNVHSGAIIEFKYKWSTDYEHFPMWYFQSSIPERYNELVASFREPKSIFVKKTQAFLTDTAEQLDKKQRPMTVRNTWAMKNVPAYTVEPYTSITDSELQRITFFDYSGATWAGVGMRLIGQTYFGKQLNLFLEGEDSIIAKAKAEKDNTKTIAAIFNYVKNALTWNKVNEVLTTQDIRYVWISKTGNSTEINLILFNLLTKAGIEAYPVTVSTPDHGILVPEFPSYNQFNKTVVYVPIDSTSYYVLDATDKQHKFDEIPYELINLNGLAINAKQQAATPENIFKDNSAGEAKLFSIRNVIPARKSVFVNAKIKPEGKITGSVFISSSSYYRASIPQSSPKDKAYIDYLKEGHNNMNVTALKFDNIDIDSLPLIAHFNFDLSIDNGSNEDYIYLNTNLFSNYISNPFLSESRNTDIDFGYISSSTFGGNYKIPANCKAEILPKNIIIKMPDNSIRLKRIIVQEDDVISIKYVIDNNKTMYNKDSYPEIRAFYKKIFEVLNEPVILKKTS